MKHEILLQQLQCRARGVFGSRVIRVVTHDKRDSALRQRACAQRGCAQRTQLTTNQLRTLRTTPLS